MHDSISAHCFDSLCVVIVHLDVAILIDSLLSNLAPPPTGPLPGIFSFLVNNAVSTSKARDVRSNIRIAAASRQNSLGAVEVSSGEVARHNQLMQEAAALRVQLNEVQAESAGFCR
jgi:hypothetical protein